MTSTSGQNKTKRFRSARGQRRRTILSAALSTAPLLTFAARLDAQTFITWSLSGNGTWSTATNWDPNNVPDANTEVAIFAGVTGPLTVTLTANATPQRVQFNSTATSQITISGTNLLNLIPNSAGLDSIFVDPDSGDHLISAPVRLGGDATQNFNIGAGRTLTISGVLSGGNDTHFLTKTGDGVLVLSGGNPGGSNELNTFTLSQGTLRLGNDNALNLAAVVLAGGTIEATGGARVHDEAFTISGNFTFAGSDTLTLSGNAGIGSVVRTITTTSTGSAKLTISGDLSDTGDTGGITKEGSGVLNLTGDNSYTGATTINGGVLEADEITTGGSNSSIGNSAGTTAGNLVINGGTLRYTGGSTDTNRQFTVGVNGGTLDASGSARIEFDSTAAITLAGTDTARTLTLTGTSTAANVLRMSIPDNGAGKTSLTKAGAGKWVLTSSAHAYTGDTTINGGTLALLATSNNIITTTPIISLASGTAVLDVVGLSSGSFNLAASQTIKGIGTVHAGTASGAGLNAAGANSVVEVGNSVGTMTITGNFNLSAATSTLGISVDLDNSDSSVLVVNGNGTSGTDVNLVGNIRFTFVSQNSGPVAGDRNTYVIILNDGSADAVSGTFAGGSPSGDDEVFTFGPLSFTIDYNFSGTDDNGVVGNGNDVAVTFSEVPEPSAAVALGGGTLLARRRRPCQSV